MSNILVEAHVGALDGTDRHLLKVRDLDLERDAEAKPGHVIVYLDEVGEVVQKLLDATVRAVNVILAQRITGERGAIEDVSS